MRIDHVPCGECVNESERIAVEHVVSKLRSHGAPRNRWIVLSNVPSAVNDRAIPDEIDLVCIGPSGFFVIEVKHWNRAFLKSNQTAVLKEATKLNDKVRRLVGKLPRAGIEPGFVAGRFLLTSPRDERSHRVYRGEHIRARDKVILDLYDLSANDDAKLDRLASSEFEVRQKLQHLACVPRLMDLLSKTPNAVLL